MYMYINTSNIHTHIKCTSTFSSSWIISISPNFTYCSGFWYSIEVIFGCLPMFRVGNQTVNCNLWTCGWISEYLVVAYGNHVGHFLDITVLKNLDLFRLVIFLQFFEYSIKFFSILGVWVKKRTGGLNFQVRIYRETQSSLFSILTRHTIEPFAPISNLSSFILFWVICQGPFIK